MNNFIVSKKTARAIRKVAANRLDTPIIGVNQHLFYNYNVARKNISTFFISALADVSKTYGSNGFAKIKVGKNNQFNRDLLWFMIDHLELDRRSKLSDLERAINCVYLDFSSYVRKYAPLEYPWGIISKSFSSTSNWSFTLNIINGGWLGKHAA